MTQKRRLAYLALLTNVVIWGAALPIVKPALTYISPFDFLFWRYAIAAVIMLPLAFFIWPKTLTLKQLVTIILLEFIQVGIGLSLLYKGLELTSALEASLIGSTSPIWVTIGGVLFLRERETRREWSGLALSVAGTVIVIVTPFLNGTHQSTPSSNLGNLFIILYTFSWMIYTLLAKKLYPNLPKNFIAVISCFVGLLSYAILTPLFTGSIPSFSTIIQEPSVMFAVLYMGLLGSALAVSLFLFGQSQIEASEATLFTYLQPLIYLPLTLLWLGDTLIPAQVLGLMIIASGVILAELRPRHRQRHQLSSS